MSYGGRNVAVGNPMPGAWWGWGRASAGSGGEGWVDRKRGVSCHCSLALPVQDSEREQKQGSLPLLACPAPALPLWLRLPLSSGGAVIQHTAAPVMPTRFSVPSSRKLS